MPASLPRERWSLKPSRIWALRVALFVPYLELALWMNARQVNPAPNAAMRAEGNLIQVHNRDLGWFAQVHPLLPAGIARLVPGGSIGLSIVGAGIAALVLAVLMERLYYQGFSRSLTLFLVATLATTPAFCYEVIGDVTGLLTLSLLALALIGCLDFVVGGETYGGFVAGLAMGIGVICNFAFVIFALVISTAGPLIGHDRVRRNPRTILASTTVLLFPTAAAVAGWAFIVWRYTGNPLKLAESTNFLTFPGGAWNHLGESLRVVGKAVGESPLFVLAGIMLALRRPRALLGVVLVPIALVACWWIGLTVSPLIIPLMLTMIGLASMPSTQWKPTLVLIAMACAVQISLGIVIDPSHGVLTQWLHLMASRN